MNNKIIVAVLFLVFTAAGFYGGITYQKSKLPSFAQGYGKGLGANQVFIQDGQRGIGPNGGSRVRMTGGQIMGEIISTDDRSVTVKLPDGSSKIILISTDTSINKAAQAALTDLKTGEKIAVFGVTNADGSVTAQNIQLNPLIRTLSPSVSPTQTP